MIATVLSGSVTFTKSDCSSTYPRLVVRFTGKQVQDALALIYVARPAVNSVQLVEQVIEALVRMVPGEFVGYNERELVSHDLRAAAEAPSVARSRRDSSRLDYCTRAKRCNRLASSIRSVSG